MHISILSVGKLRAGPERSLVEDYASRFRKTGPRIGFRSLDILEVASGGGLDAEGARLISALPREGDVLRLDEHGQQWRSLSFAQDMAARRDEGIARLTFVIGGAQGYSPEVQNACPHTIGFGIQTWPHRLVKVMLTEQLYRAVSLLTGSPYHKA